MEGPFTVHHSFRPESAAADFATLRTDLAAGLDRLLGAKAAR